MCILIICLKPPPKPDNSQFIALSVAGAGFFVVLATACKFLDERDPFLRAHVVL